MSGLMFDVHDEVHRMTLSWRDTGRGTFVYFRDPDRDGNAHIAVKRTAWEALGSPESIAMHIEPA